MISALKGGCGAAARNLRHQVFMGGRDKPDHDSIWGLAKKSDRRHRHREPMTSPNAEKVPWPWRK
jgi:hypothetical protein